MSASVKDRSTESADARKLCLTLDKDGLGSRDLTKRVNWFSILLQSINVGRDGSLVPSFKDVD